MGEGTDGGISRRRVVVGAAWAAPVIVLAVSAPARAASTSVPGLVIALETFQLNGSNIDLQFQLMWQGVEPEGYLTPAIDPCYVQVSIPDAMEPGTPVIANGDGVFTLVGSSADPDHADHTLYVFLLAGGLSSTDPSASFEASVPFSGPGTGTGYAWGTGSSVNGPVISNTISASLA